MKLLSSIRRRLALKLFLSYLIIILVSVIVLSTAVSLETPRAFTRHMGIMSGMMGNPPGIPEINLFTNFRAGVTEALTVAALAAFLVAVLVSVFISRQVVAPVREMMLASQRVAEGHYDERVNITGNIGRDELDELGELALSFNQMAAKLEKIESMRRQLIGDVAHELRTPLATIKGSMEGLIDGVLTPDAETFQQIHREADRLQRLVDDLQELSRVEAGTYELHRHPVEVSTLVADTLRRLGRQYEEKGVRLNSEVPDNLPHVLVDQDRIDQVLLNLVGNALQYTPAGGTVRIAAQQQDEDAVRMSISDTGIGISAEHLPYLFTRFYRVDKSRSRAGGGSGIGLTIARHLVEAHGGRIWAESPGPGQGSSFTFTLPVAKE